MFTKEEKTEWIQKQIKEDRNRILEIEKRHYSLINHLPHYNKRIKTLEIEIEIMEEWIKMRGFLNSDDEVIIGKDLTDEESEKLLKQIKESKEGKAEPMHICIVHQTKPEDLTK